MAAERAIVLMKGYLGDAVMTIPLLRALLDYGYEVHVVTSPGVISLLQRTLPTVHFYKVRQLDVPRELLKQAKEMREIGAKAVFITNRSFRSALAARLSGIPNRIGHKTDGRGWLLTKTLPYDKLRNEANCYLDLARLAKIPTGCNEPELVVTPESKAAGLKRLQGANLGVQPGARHEDKQLPLPVLASVVRTLQAEGMKVALFGGAEEKGAGEAFVELLDEPVVDLIGQCSLEETPGILSNLRLMLGSDTGLMHIAAASGCPTVTCFGPTRSSKWGHMEPPHQVVDGRDRDISTITPEEVLTAVRAALSQS